MFTKRELIEYLSTKRMGYEYGIPDEMSKEKAIKEIALEMWCDDDMFEFVCKSDKQLATDIYDDYFRRLTRYMTSSTTEEGRASFFAALTNAVMTWDDLTTTYGDDFY